jgi:hypothetical protein
VGASHIQTARQHAKINRVYRAEAGQLSFMMNLIVDILAK